MREILFRGKRLDNGEWVIGFITAACDCAGRLYFIEQPAQDLDDCNHSYEVDFTTVGQYTGLTDDNGNKIFEGDIIRVKSFDWDYEYTTKVYYSSHTLCVNLCNQDYDYTSIGFANDVWDEENSVVEVIGNIYDNPELLKEALK